MSKSLSLIGYCGNCGGPVMVPTVWYGVFPPTPECQKCGAIPKSKDKPVLEMEGSEDNNLEWWKILSKQNKWRLW